MGPLLRCSKVPSVMARNLVSGCLSYSSYLQPSLVIFERTTLGWILNWKMLAEWVPFESFFHSFATLTVSRRSKHFLILQKLFPFLSTKATMASRMSLQRNFCCWHLAWPDASLTQNGRKFDAGRVSSSCNFRLEFLKTFLFLGGLKLFREKYDLPPI